MIRITDGRLFRKRQLASMSSRLAVRRILSLALALSVGVWAESGLAMLSAANHTPQWMSHAHHALAAMPCCPSRPAEATAHFFDPPPCCDLSSQPARPLASAITPGKFRSGQSGVMSERLGHHSRGVFFVGRLTTLNPLRYAMYSLMYVYAFTYIGVLVWTGRFP